MSSALWVWITIIGACIGGYYYYKQGKIPWLRSIKTPKIFEPKPVDLVKKLQAQTEKEVAKAEELRGVLEAKRGLAKAKAGNIRLRREIDGVSEKSIERDKQDEQKEQEAQSVKPKRL